jgi:superfamily I DNA/RNA helicase
VGKHITLEGQDKDVSTAGLAIRVMTIQAAKNRQFRDVVVLWGPGVSGDANHQRRLLYNAISRAEHGCTVMVRTQQQLQQPPFT